tara:strand:+ start:354 stop:791 length:438 start_codon:yes stop_codon:yes gene_type:complete
MTIIKRIYNIERVEKTAYCFAVEATSKAEALRMVDNYEVHYTDAYGLHDYRPKVTSIDEYTVCPNNGRAWSNIPLSEVTFDDDGNPRRNGKHFNWHYNGKCKGEKTTTEDFCYECSIAMESGHRFTTSAENAYLNGQYGVGLKEY